MLTLSGNKVHEVFHLAIDILFGFGIEEFGGY